MLIKEIPLVIILPLDESFVLNKCHSLRILKKKKKIKELIHRDQVGFILGDAGMVYHLQINQCDIPH